MNEHLPSIIPVDAFEALHLEHRLELAKLNMQLLKYHNLLIEHGIEPPDADGGTPHVE